MALFRQGIAVGLDFEFGSQRLCYANEVTQHMPCHWSVYFSLQDQNKLTNAALVSLFWSHLHYRHGDGCTFCATKSLKKVNSSRFTDFMSFDCRQTPVDGVRRFSTSIACSASACR